MKLIAAISSLIAGLLIASTLHAASGEFQAPDLKDPVMDLAHIITPRDQEQLRGLLREFHEHGKGQLQILTVPSLNGMEIEEYAIRVVEQWKLGDEKKDDGVLLLVAMQEKKIRIEVGQGLEGVIPDITAKQIVSDVMAPFFRQGLASQGIVQGASAIIAEVDKDLAASGKLPEVRRKKVSLFKRYEGLFILAFVLLFAMSNLFRPRRRRSFWGGGGGWGGGPFIGGGGWGGGGSSGGGGWSGGGGGFSGGGASGSW